MCIHIGNDEVVLTKDVIMILDRYALISKDTSDFLQVAREEGFVVEPSEQGKDKKSLRITDKKMIFFPISSVTLLKRADFIKKL